MVFTISSTYSRLTYKHLTTCTKNGKHCKLSIIQKQKEYRYGLCCQTQAVYCSQDKTLYILSKSSL